MNKNNLPPILTHNYKSPSCISPGVFIKYQNAQQKPIKQSLVFPKYCILTSQKNIVGYFEKKFGAKVFKNWTSNRSKLYVLKVGRKLVGIINVGVGAPQAVTLMEMMIAYGAKNFFVIGSVGSINRDLEIGSFILATKAIRDEGVSYHYLRPNKYANSSDRLVKSFKKYLKKQTIKFTSGAIWTTDAFYRETKADIVKYQKQGVLGVDMKTASIFSLARYRRVNTCGFFYISDSVANLVWEPFLYSSAAKKAQKEIAEITFSFLSQIK